MVSNFDTQMYDGVPIAEAIARYRAAHCITQGEFAEIAGLSKMTINLIENGKGGREGSGNISVITWGKIVKVLEAGEKAD